MKKFWKKYRVYIIIVAVIALLIAVGQMGKAVDPHAGHDHATGDHTETGQTADPHAGHDHSDYTADKSYTLTTDANGRYTVQVKDAHGSTFYSRTNLLTQPTCTATTADILCISNTEEPITSRWAIFCNVKQGTTTVTYNGCLATKGTYVAYGSNADGTWTVHVEDAFNASAYNQVHTLEGAYAIDSRSVIDRAELTDDGNLLVTYWAGDVEKTTTIKMP